MSLRAGLLWLFLICLIPLVGCGGNSDPVNDGKDRPIPPPKKEKDKDK